MQMNRNSGIGRKRTEAGKLPAEQLLCPSKYKRQRENRVNDSLRFETQYNRYLCLGLNVTSRSTAIIIINQKQIYVRAQGDKAQGKTENKRKVES